MADGGAGRLRAVAAAFRVGCTLSLALALGGKAQADADPPASPAAVAPAADTPAADTPAADTPAADTPAEPVGFRSPRLHMAGADAMGEGLPLKYLLEGVRVVGNRRTRERLIRPFIPIDTGSSFDVNDPELEAFRYRLLGTGWYDRVELRLERGKHAGWVVLVVDVEERETLAFQQLALGMGWSVARVDPSNGNTPSRQAEPYLGVAVADSNFLGLGKTLGTELLIARGQQGFAISYTDPVVRSSRWGFRARASFVNGQEYFGGDHNVLVNIDCKESETSTQQSASCSADPLAAVVDYWRAGLTVGTARDLGSYSRVSVDYQGDFVNVPYWGLPLAASELRGKPDNPLSRHPIDFAIARGNSYVSMLKLGFLYDKRDSAILPTRGLLGAISGAMASKLLGSGYDFVRFEASVHRWIPTHWGHTVRVGAYAGAVFGNAPFFYKFFVSDLTDLQPSRILGLNLDHRPAPNLLGLLECKDAFNSRCGTAIAQMRQEELAARVDVEYMWPIVRGRRKFLKSADAYALFGLYALADPHDLDVSVPGYSGLARIPFDLTFDLGVRLDTQVGVFQIGAAKLFWLPVQ